MTSQEGAPLVGPADAEGVIEQMHVAMRAFVLGRPRPVVDLVARRADVTLRIADRTRDGELIVRAGQVNHRPGRP